MSESLFTDGEAAANTDREIWRKGDGDGNGMSYYEPSIHVTEQGAIGINVGGTVITMQVEKWHEVALERYALVLPKLKHRSRLRRFLSEPSDAPNWLVGALALDVLYHTARGILGV